MNVALSTMWWGEGGDAVDALASRTRSLGFTHVELEYRRPAASISRIGEALARNGLAVSSVHAPFPRPAGDDPLRQADLAAEDGAARHRAEALVVRTIEEAAVLGAGVVVLHSGNIEVLAPLERRLMALYWAGEKGASDFLELQEELGRRRALVAPRRLAWVQESLGRLAARAEALGLVIGLENRAYFHDLPSFEEMGLLLGTLGPTLGYWHDFGHAFRLEALGFYAHTAWLEAYGGRLVGLHLHDCVGLDDHRPPGQGETAWEQLVSLLPAQGLRVLEVDAGHGDEALAAGLAYLQDVGVLR